MTVVCFCRYFWEVSGAFCISLHYKILGPLHECNLHLQHSYEGEVDNSILQRSQPINDLCSNLNTFPVLCAQVVFLALAYATVYLIYMRFRSTFNSESDSFRVEFLLVPVAGLSFLENYAFAPLEILWTFSIYLESVAILPQLFMITKTGEAESITTHYLFFLGLYRALYLANWVWRYHTEGFFDQIAVVSGVVQTIFYCDFFYLYVTRVLRGSGKMSLPMPI
uniref:ER lumen protein-retaining receptor n=1 Tax=Oncorhynchus kisutch TaxID=8019 RepID=A0A8C7FEU9_ONCKI